MRAEDLIKGRLVHLAYALGYNEGLNGMLAVSFMFRDRVRAGWFNGSWAAVLNNYRDAHYSTEPLPEEMPDPNNYAIRGLLQSIDGVFNGSLPNTITISQDPISNAISLAAAPKPPLYCAYLNQITSEKFLLEIARKPENHPRVAQVGQMFFFA